MFKYCLRISKNMVNLIVSLSEETLKKLRKAVKEKYGGKKGALSDLVQAAVIGHLDALEAAKPSQRFRAVRGDETVAEGKTIQDLAIRLKEVHTDPRSVRIISLPSVSPVARAGFRARQV